MTRDFAVFLDKSLSDAMERAEQTLPLPEAAAMTLGERFHAMMTPPPRPFEPGDIVIAKPGLDMRNEEYRSQPMIVVDVASYDGFQIPPRTLANQGYLMPQADMRGMFAARVDCVVLWLAKDGDVMPMFWDSRRLRHWAPTP